MEIEKLRSIIDNTLRNTSYVSLTNVGIIDLTNRIVSNIITAKKIEEENKMELDVKNEKDSQTKRWNVLVLR